MYNKFEEIERNEQKEQLNKALAIYPDLKRDTCTICQFEGICKVSTEEYKDLDSKNIEYIQAWVFNNDNKSKYDGKGDIKPICYLCNSIKGHEEELKQKAIWLKKYVKTIKPVYICQMCQSWSHDSELFKSKAELIDHVKVHHESYDLKRAVDKNYY